MVQTLQAKNVTLGELSDRFNLELTEDEQFFPEWQVDLTEITAAEKQRLDRVKSSFSNLLEYPPLLEDTVKMVVLSPLLDMADFYLPPFHIKSEPSIEITTEDGGMIIRGQLDVLALCKQVWVVSIESKNAEFSLEAGRAQLLSYMLANPKSALSTFGLLTNGSSFRFVKLVSQPAPRYGLSRVFDLFNPGHDLYEVLKILKYLGQMTDQGK
ncbi:MAG: restriction endonuclease subunit R [Aphanocapsa sp. GSE-SYN-MK-11-07L]|jgi:hypothetical protein|nr:restriction endonuclease subunit R [Aphanocapsa sp. GSE-SYN-MK-11-07L]